MKTRFMKATPSPATVELPNIEPLAVTINRKQHFEWNVSSQKNWEEIGATSSH